MGDWVGHFKGYDVQETRRVEREKGIERLINILKKLETTKETVILQLMEEYEFTEDEAIKAVEKYW